MAHDSWNLFRPLESMVPLHLSASIFPQVHGRHLSDDELIKLIEASESLDLFCLEEGFSVEKEKS